MECEAEPELYPLIEAEPEPSLSNGEHEMLRVLRDLVAAIEFEGPSGGIHFNPGTPWELDVLTDARRIADKYFARLF